MTRPRTRKCRTSRRTSRSYFAWSGATKNGGLAYDQIQGPTVVIEYAPRNGDPGHIHTTYRDPINDYGAKLVAAR